MSDRLRSIQLSTHGGELCRTALLRLVAYQQAAVGTFSRDLEHGSPTWASTKRFEHAMEASDLLFDRDERPCLAAAPRSVRPQLDAIMKS